VRAKVLVRPKPGILDPQGEAVERMCERLLANPLIESYEVEIVGEPAA
jgi:phosphoribosylformylglycinamidine (FGAM) synthase PurS component